MKTVYVYKESRRKPPALVELTDLENRRQPLRDLLADIDATHWCDWVNAWEPAESTEARSREPGTPLTSASPFNLQALDALAALKARSRSGRAV